MREIKFRAWDKKRGSFHWGISNVCLTLGGNLMWQFGQKAPDFLDKEESEQFILQQYTGLHDKNGKEIYEGDILQDTRIKDRIWLSVVDFGIWGWLGLGDYPSMVIVGNVYENPELLKL